MTQVRPARQKVTIKLKDLNLDLDGDGQLDGAEKRLLAQLKRMDVDGNGEIGLAELCSLGQGLEREKQQNKNLTKIVWAVVGLSVMLVVLSFVAAFAANEASKDTKPATDGTLETVSGVPVSTAALNQHVPIASLALLTTAALDGLSKLKFTLGDTTFSYTVTGYSLAELSPSQRSVSFYTARGDVVVVSSDAGVQTAKVKTSAGTLDIATATTASTGRRRMLEDETSTASGTSTTGSGEVVEVEDTNGCDVTNDSGAEWMAAADEPDQGFYSLCSFSADLNAVCCYTAELDSFTVVDCGADSTKCKATAVEGEDLSSVLPDVTAPAAGYVSIYTVDSSGSLAFFKTMSVSNDPAKCKPKQYNYLCVYGEEEEVDDSVTEEETTTPAETPEATEEDEEDTYVGSMDDCLDFVSRFDTTGDFDDEGNCTGTDDSFLVGTKPNGDTTTSTLTRYFCMECVSVEDYHDDCADTSLVPYDVVIHIYTNSLPNHNMNSNVGKVTNDDIASPVEVVLPFKPDLIHDLETGTNAVETNDDLDAILCDHSWVGSNYMGEKKTTHVGLDTDCDGEMDGKYEGVSTWSGIGLDGVELASGLSSNDVDPHYPSIDGGLTFNADEVENIDGSLGHFSGSSLYHYHIASPVYADLDLDTADIAGAECSEITDCADVTLSTSPTFSGMNQIAGFMMFGTGSGGYMNPNNPLITDQQDDELGPIIGIALDGRPIRGPVIYSSTDANWKQVTGLDICNGRMPSAASSEREYSYYASHTTPTSMAALAPDRGTPPQSTSSRPVPSMAPHAIPRLRLTSWSFCRRISLHRKLQSQLLDLLLSFCKRSNQCKTEHRHHDNPWLLPVILLNAVCMALYSIRITCCQQQ